MKNKNNRNGYVLLYAVIILGVVTLTTVVALSILSSNSIISGGEFLKSKQARVLADACAAKALQNIRDNESFTGDGGLSFENGLCEYSVLDTGGENREINVSGTVDGSIRKAKIIISQINPQINVSSWEEVSEEETIFGAYWRFDENKGEEVFDSLHNSDGKINGAQWTSDSVGGSTSALDFGEKNYIDIGNTEFLNIEGKELSLEAWVKWKKDPQEWASYGEEWVNIIDKNGENEWQLQHSQMNDHFEFAVRTDIGKSHVSSDTVPEENVWYFVVGVYDGSQIKIYVNGKLENTRPRDGNINTSSSEVNIGRRTYGDRYFIGIIDEVRVSATAFSDEYILERYNSMKPEEEEPTKPVSYWAFDENKGNEFFDSADGNNGKFDLVKWTDDGINHALDFNEEKNYMVVSDADNLKITEKITIMAWAKTRENKTAKIVQKGDWDGYGLYLDVWQGWKGHIYTDDKESHSLSWGEKQPDLGEWYCLALTYDGTVLKLYVDGDLKNSEPVSGKLRITNRDMFFGSDGGEQKFFNGIIDEVYIYNSALEANEIKSYYDSNQPPISYGAHWHLEKNEENIAYDSLNDCDGKIDGAQWAEGISGSGLDFGGKDSVGIPSSEHLNIKESALTIEAWIQWAEDPYDWGVKTGNRWASIINKNGNNEWQLQHSSDNRNIEFALNTTSGRRFILSETKLKKGEWYYVVGVYDGSDMLLYINGKMEKSSSFGGEIRNSLLEVYFGRYASGGRYFRGIIDEVKIHNSALSEKEIEENYNTMSKGSGEESKPKEPAKPAPAKPFF